MHLSITATSRQAGALLVARVAAQADLRRMGTGTVSATNVYRAAGATSFAVAASARRSTRRRCRFVVAGCANGSVGAG